MTPGAGTVACCRNTNWDKHVIWLGPGGKEIQIGTDGEAVFYGVATSLWVASSGTARASVVAYP